jgi:hypothetical protein
MMGFSPLAERVWPRQGQRRGVADGPFRSVPPGMDNIWVPVWSRRAALTGLSLRASCRPAVIGAHHAVWGLVALAGPRALPGPAMPWQPPMPAPLWQVLEQQWSAALHGYDGMAIYERPQARRTGFGVLLLEHDRSVAFVKVIQGPDRGEATWQALRALIDDPLRDCQVPRPLARGGHDGWSWMATTPIPWYPHRPARQPPIGRIAADVSERLSRAFPPAEVPDHWRPMHGDLAPWNLRRVGPRALWLLDWDDAGWGPPGADAAYYEATVSLVRGRRPEPGSASEETVRFWIDRVESRLRAGIDLTYNVALVTQLSGMV